VNRLIAVLLLLFTGPVLAVHEPWITETFPQDLEKWWWDDAWWQEGQLDTPGNHAVTVEETSYRSGDVEVPAYLFRPTTPGDHLPVLFLHGRRGLDDLTLLLRASRSRRPDAAAPAPARRAGLRGARARPVERALRRETADRARPGRRGGCRARPRHAAHAAGPAR
jgi:hypothetical protein